MRRSVVVIGAGQAGLSVSLRLRAAGIDHVVLERHTIAQAWRDRWDSFTLVTPNWTLDLPGHPYDGPDPEGHVARDEIVAYLESCAEQAGEIRTGVRVDLLAAGRSGRFHLETSDGPLEADDVVVCTGAYQRPHRPSVLNDLPAGLLVLDATGYVRPDDAAGRRRSRHRQRANRRAAGGGASSFRPRRDAGLRQGALAAPPPRRPRHRHLALPLRLLRAALIGVGQPGRPPAGQFSGDRGRRWSGPAPADPADARGTAGRPAHRSLRPPGVVRR